MRPMVILTAGVIIAANGLSVAPVRSEASWGCQILLCAASRNPSWHGVPYCVPPMSRLIAAMARPGFSWPVCHEANAGKPGREIYHDCPAGTTVGYSISGDNGGQRVPDQCIATVNVCHARNRSEIDNRSNSPAIHRPIGGRRDSCIQEIATPRPRRTDPWFFDIPNDKGVKERFWFNLKY